MFALSDAREFSYTQVPCLDRQEKITEQSNFVNNVTVMHLSMLSPRVGGGGGGREDPGEFDILMAARVKFPTPRHLLNVNFPPLG